MPFAALGRNISPAEVTNISAHGFWLFVAERELFVPFQYFPWFRDASIRGDHQCAAPEPTPPLLARLGHRPRCGVNRAPGEIPAGQPGAA